MHLARDDAGGADEDDVEQRHGENEDRCQQPDEVVLGPLAHDREPGQREADERGAGVAEEDRGRPSEPQIVGYEAETRADEWRREEHQVGLISLQRGQAEEQRRERAETGREAVHAVEELERVRDCEKPHQREHHVDRKGAGPRRRDGVEHDAEPHRHRHRAHLPEQLPARRQIEHVVENADRDDDRRPDGDALERQ